MSGEFRGRKLLALPKGVEGLRPSSGRVRSAIFDRLQDEIVGARVLDLFAGSGALAIEALSRGAVQATLVEHAPALQRHLRRQLSQLGLDQRAHLRAMDAQRFLADRAAMVERSTRGSTGDATFDMVFIDPPYGDVDAYSRSLEGLIAGRLLAPEAVIVCERSRRASLAPWPEVLLEEATRRHGDSVLHFLRAN